MHGRRKAVESLLASGEPTHQPEEPKLVEAALKEFRDDQVLARHLEGVPFGLGIAVLVVVTNLAWNSWSGEVAWRLWVVGTIIAFVFMVTALLRMGAVEILRSKRKKYTHALSDVRHIMAGHAMDTPVK